MSEGDCIFCKIARGVIPCAQVYSTDRVLAFLDIAPVNEGHVLVVPKQHFPTLFDLPADLGAEMLEALQRVGRAVMQATAADGINLGMNNYAAAGQLVGHAHFHLIPRFADDGLKLWQQKSYPNTEKMHSLATAIDNFIIQA